MKCGHAKEVFPIVLLRKGLRKICAGAGKHHPQENRQAKIVVRAERQDTGRLHMRSAGIHICGTQIHVHVRASEGFQSL